MKYVVSFVLTVVSFVSFSQTAPAVITSPDPTVCLGNSVTISTSAPTVNSPIVNTYWSITGPNGYIYEGNTLGGASLVLNLPFPGNYSLSVINVHQNSSGSSKQITDFITIYDKPFAEINAVVNTCDLPFAVSYNMGNSTPSGVTYSWTFQGGNPSSATSPVPPTVNYTTAGSYNTRLIITNSTTGCKDTAVKIINVSLFDAEIIAPESACVGEAVQLTDASTLGVNSWNWSAIGLGVVSFSNPSSQNPTATFSSPGTYTITLNSSNTVYSCNGSATKTIIIKPLPSPSFTVNPLIGCAPLNVNLTNTTVASGTFVWDFGDGTPTFTGQYPPTHSYLENGSYTPSMTMTGSNGCSASIVGSTINLTSPVANFSQTEVNLCEPKTVTFTDASTAPGTIVSWEIIYGDGNSQILNNNNIPAHNYLCGIYTPSLVIAMANGCRDTVVGAEIKVGSPLNVGFEGDTLLRCVKKPIKLHSTTVIDCIHDDSDLIYTWSFNNVPVIGDSSYTKIFTDTMQNVSYGTDVALQIDFRGCKSSDTIVDYLYIKAPVSRFTIDNLLFCDQGQQATPLGKMITVNDNPSVYGHVGPSIINHPLYPNGPIIPIPTQAMDDVQVTYKWDDGTPNTQMAFGMDDSEVEDADKGSTTHIFDDYGTFQVWQIIENLTTGCKDSTSQIVNVSWIETSFVFDIFGPDSVCIYNPFQMTANSGTHGVPDAQSEPHTPLSYSFNMGNGDNVTGSGSTENQTLSYIYYTPGNYDVVLTTTNSVGCVATSAPDHITAFALPIAVLTTNDDLSGCVGEPFPVTFQNQSIHPPGSFGFGNNNTGWYGTDPFNWTFSNGSPSDILSTNSIGQTVTSTMNGPSTTTLQVKDGFGCVSNIVSLSSTVNQPLADINVNSQICNSDLVNGLITFAGNGNITTYEWILDGVSQITSSPSIPFPASWYIPNGGPTSTSHEIGLKITDVDGCEDTLDPEKTITILAPQADFDFITYGAVPNLSGEFNCPPVIVDFTDNSQSTSAITSHSWILGTVLSNPNAVTTNNSNPKGIQYLYAGSYDATLIIEDAAGCVDSLVMPDFLIINGPSGDPNITLNSGVCGQDFTFDLNNPVNVGTWLWNLGDGTTINNTSEPDNNFIHSYPGVNTYYPTLFLSDDQGCTIPYYDTIIIGPNGVDAFFTASPTEIGLGTTVNFDDDSHSTGGSLVNWIWNFGDGNTLSSNNGNNVSNQYYSSGQVPVTLTVEDSRGCKDDYTLYLTVDIHFEIANVLTGAGSGGPNPDFILFGDIFNDFKITIVNRWGNLVYEGSRDVNNPLYLWNGIDQKSGELCNEGTYFYKLDGTLKNNEPVSISGPVSLVGTIK